VVSGWGLRPQSGSGARGLRMGPAAAKRKWRSWSPDAACGRKAAVALVVSGWGLRPQKLERSYKISKLNFVIYDVGLVNTSRAR
jgi:hypothetical protein